MNLSEKKQSRICLVSDQLATGGAERCAALLSKFFDKNNCAVHHVIVVDKIEYDYAGEVLNLGSVKNISNSYFNRIKRFLILQKFFKNNKFDFIIDFRVKNKQWQEFFIAKFIYKSPLIVSVRSYNTDWYFPKNNFLANTIYSHCYNIIAVSEKIKNKIHSDFKYKNVEIIYNPIDFEFIDKQASQNIEIDYKFILAVGRMDDNIKQFDKLIYCYSKSELIKKNIKLIILGDGPLQITLIDIVKELNLEDFVIFKNRIQNPFQYYKKALFTVLSSKNEGFPNVLIESLACGTPVVAFDCPSGPSEIIEQNINGLLVENQNEEKLTYAINELVSNEKLYYNCKSNAKLSVMKLDIENIGNKWLTMMKIDK